VFFALFVAGRIDLSSQQRLSGSSDSAQAKKKMSSIKVTRLGSMGLLHKAESMVAPPIGKKKTNTPPKPQW